MLAAIAARISAFLAASGVKLIAVGTVLLAVFMAGVKVESRLAAGRYNALLAKHEKERADALEAARVHERSMFAQRELVERMYTDAAEKTRRSLASANADRDRLRNLVAQFDAYSVPAAAGSATGAGGTCAEAGLVASAEELARAGVRLVAEADRVADEATQAASTCADRLTALQDYVRIIHDR